MALAQLSHDQFFGGILFNKSPARGLTVIDASTHGLLRPTCNHNHKVVASASAKIFGTSESQ